MLRHKTLKQDTRRTKEELPVFPRPPVKGEEEEGTCNDSSPIDPGTVLQRYTPPFASAFQQWSGETPGGKKSNQNRGRQRLRGDEEGDITGFAEDTPGGFPQGDDDDTSCTRVSVAIFWACDCVLTLLQEDGDLLWRFYGR